MIGVRPRQTVPEVKCFEKKGVHLLSKAVIVLFLVSINFSVRDFSRRLIL